MLAGVTILTHGLSGSIDGWIASAATSIARRIGANDTSQYVMRVEEVAKDTLGVTSFQLERGPGIERSVNSEAIIRLDWTDMDSGGYSTGDVANVVADYLLNWHGSARPLAGLPMHLIGHSRGASLMSVVAQRLGERGVWVDQATYLDPHPLDGGIENGFIDYGDAGVRAWDNITFADDYWRDDGPVNLEPDGEDITGTYQGDLNDTVQKEHKDSAHMAVTAYYVGTIDLSAKDGGDEPIYDSWYGTGAGKAPRDATGYAFSRLGGTPRPVSGLREPFGGQAARRQTGQQGSQWGNVSDLQVLRGTHYVIGEKIPLRVKRQDRDGGDTITMWIDRDRNPFNDNNLRKIRSLSFGETDDVTPTRINGSSSGIDPGKYYVYARITDAAGNARYTYSRRITLTDPTLPSQRQASPFASQPIIESLATRMAKGRLLDAEEIS